MDLKNSQKKTKFEESSSEEESDDGVDNVEYEQESEESEDEIENPIRNHLQSELTKMSFEDIQKLQNKLGLKKYKDVVQSEKANAEKQQQQNSFKRLNKNRPREMSSKRPVSTARKVFTEKLVRKPKIVDPRFDTAYGEYQPDLFRKNYSFVNEIRKNEKEILQKQLKVETNFEKKKQIKAQLERLNNQIKAYSENEKKKEMKEKIKVETLKDINEGKKPHYVNKSEMKLLELAEKYKELKKSGKVDKFLAKKRKKQLTKVNKHFKGSF